MLLFAIYLTFLFLSLLDYRCSSISQCPHCIAGSRASRKAYDVATAAKASAEKSHIGTG
jgi:hypothetical protein